MSSALKRDFMELLKSDEEFRLAAAGLLGLETILRELREQGKRLEEQGERLRELERRLSLISMELGFPPT